MGKNKNQPVARPTVREIREAKGWSQPEFCMRAHISMSSLYRLEKGLPVSRLTAGRAAQTLGLELGQIGGINIIQSGTSPRLAVPQMGRQAENA